MNNWQASNRPQEKSRKTPRKHAQWLAAHKLLVARLKAGINYNGKPWEQGFFVYGALT